MQKQGTLSINSENIFPIIKKWLYSDHDIFMRELISNGCDAITKLKKLDMMGEYSIPEGNQFKIRVVVNSKDKTLSLIHISAAWSGNPGLKRVHPKAAFPVPAPAS